jgi:Tfp pilus assembly protein PilV
MPVLTHPQISGFSLLEVLLSLLLISTTCLTLLQQHIQAQRLLTQCLREAEASLILDNMEEAQLAQMKRLPEIPSPYQFQMGPDPQGSYFEVKGYGGLIDRKRHYG